MNLPRSSGILLHPTSLPGRFGIGDLGPEAYRFVEFLQEAGQRLWQVLPLGPTGYGDSPYQCFSAFAGNPLLIGMERLVDQGLLPAGSLRNTPAFPEESTGYGQVIAWKMPLLECAGRAFLAQASGETRARFEAFGESQAGWLDDFALFMALKRAHGEEAVWTHWDPDIRSRQPAALDEWRRRLSAEIDRQRFYQFEFFVQWWALKQVCASSGIRVMGDVPIYVAHDSADVWAHPQYFDLDESGNPASGAGVPPDYFSATGQLWGNPLYRWDVLAASGYEWWIERLGAALSLVDLLRLDHFRGFAAYWAVPAGETTAVNGRWLRGPGAAFLQAAVDALGELPLVAENLGVITPEVEALRLQFGFPGMSILQFAFGKDPQAPDFRPHNYPRQRVAYTGTHDCDTTAGWWSSAGKGESTRTAEDIRRELDFARRYLNTDGREIHWDSIRALMASVADTVIVPLQDVLGLGSEARMNLPATPSGNWRWRYKPGALTPELTRRLRELTEVYER
ncbi:MAG: 4-alpha-glucanotransferase [Candidatus Solibacter usitatus]|nr:4-alpha-glucanotransferase [Candidatus Solibacter usitatus]